jgi:hypothetical protein
MSGVDGEDAAKEAGRRRREFIRAHHPDRGGDTESFVAGLRGFDAGPAPADPPPRVVIVKHQSWLTRLVTAAIRRLRHEQKPTRVR